MLFVYLVLDEEDRVLVVTVQECPELSRCCDCDVRGEPEMWAEIALIAVSGIGSMAVVAALVYSARQAKTLQAQLAHQIGQADEALIAQRAANDLKLMEHAMALDRVFVDAPELRGFFYEGWEPPVDSLERARVMATAELIVDLADTVASMVRHGQLDEKDVTAWRSALQGYGRSPAVRLVAAAGEGAWRESTLKMLIAGPTGRHLVTDSPQVAQAEF
jgi:hypothetical protein